MSIQGHDQIWNGPTMALVHSSLIREPKFVSGLAEEAIVSILKNGELSNNIYVSWEIFCHLQSSQQPHVINPRPIDEHSDYQHHLPIFLQPLQSHVEFEQVALAVRDLDWRDSENPPSSSSNSPDNFPKRGDYRPEVVPPIVLTLLDPALLDRSERGSDCKE